MTETLLSVRDLQVHFRSRERTIPAVERVSFDLAPGRTLGIVGESGSGKSVTSLAVLGLIPPPGEIAAGEIWFEGRDLTKLDRSALRNIRGGRIGMIFQDPMTSLNPFLRVADQIMEITRLHLGHSRREAEQHAVKMLDLVGIPDARARAQAYPHQFSGGMRQRVMIAMALACRPQLLIADEPTTALDVTIQAQILDLMRDLRDRIGTSMILITHDLGVVAGVADHVIVMYAGRIFESAPASELFRNPQNPYTRALLACTPDPARRGATLHTISGLPPDPARLDENRCPFADRCPEAIDRCRHEYPPHHSIGEDHSLLCWVR
jgi:oligopeptide/dipeptide ABC transporter ATP-binding protein